MAKEQFLDINLSDAKLERIDQVNGVIGEYFEEGYIMTLRQLFYQLITRDVIPNDDREYSKLSTLLKDGRMCGLVVFNEQVEKETGGQIVRKSVR